MNERDATTEKVGSDEDRKFTVQEYKDRREAPLKRTWVVPASGLSSQFVEQRLGAERHEVRNSYTEAADYAVPPNQWRQRLR